MAWIWALEVLRDLTCILFPLRLIALALALVLILPIESWAGAFRPFETVDLGVSRIALFVVLPVAGVVLVEQV